MKVNFEIDTFEKAYSLLEVYWEVGTSRRLKLLFQKFPELKKASHAQIASLLGVWRETVTRKIKEVLCENY